MHLTNGFIIREIAGEVIAIPTGDVAHDFSGLMLLNETGQFLFGLLQSPQTKTSLVTALLEEFDTDELTAQNDVEEFLETLKTNNVLVDD